LYLFFFCLVSDSIASEPNAPEISDVSLTINGGHLFLSFRLINGMPGKMEELVKSGVPVRYIFNVTIKKKGLLWDDELKSMELRRTIRFDNLRNRYFLHFDYPSTKLISIEKLKRAKKFLFNVQDLKLISMKRLEKGEKYTIEIKARSEKGESSLPFSRLVKMFTSFGFSSKTYEFEFTL